MKEGWLDSCLSDDSIIQGDEELINLKQDVRHGNLLLKLESQKVMGILPENFYPVDIEISFSDKTAQQEADAEFKSEKKLSD